ncbi:hypothetical protein F66182_5117 [Fusarium sp. NRRL 66182]|nr:hypothetical protein F66182_5117 [Fusarium sp. NRRL 66182]
MSSLPTEDLASYQDLSTIKSWDVELVFSSDGKELQKDKLIDLSVDWHATLILKTSDIVGIMKEGLFLTQDDIEAQESQPKRDYCNKTKRHCWCRHYTISHARWPGTITIKTLKHNVAAGFRVQHLSADNVYFAEVKDKYGMSVYKSNLWNSMQDFNLILDDLPMPGLWPWPRKETDQGGGQVAIPDPNAKPTWSMATIRVQTPERVWDLSNTAILAIINHYQLTRARPPPLDAYSAYTTITSPFILEGAGL